MSNTLLKLDLQETSGTTFADASGNANHGTADGGLAAGYDSVAGPGGSFPLAVEFDGIDDTIEVAHAPELVLGTDPWTIAVWVNFTELASGAQFPAVLGKGDTGVGEWMLRSSVDGVMNFYSSGNYGQVDGLQTLTGYDLVYTFDGTYLRSYLDTVLQTTESFAVNLSTSKALQIGAADGAANRMLHGRVAAVLITDDALGQAAIDARHAELTTSPSDFKPKQVLRVGQTARQLSID